MPDCLTVEAGAVRGGRAKLVVSKVSEAGAILAQASEYFEATSQSRSAARLLNVPAPAVSAAVGTFRATGESRFPLDTPPPVAPATPATQFALRGRRQPRAEGVNYDTFEEALAAPTEAAEPVIEWQGVDDVCALDVDFHHGYAPDPADLRAAANVLQPAPFLWWITRSGGLRGMYRRIDLYTAEELAGVAGFQLLLRFPTALLEFKDRTRRAEGEVFRSVASDEIACVRRLFANTVGDEAAYAEWLDERGLVPGQRYDHDHCPVNPSPRAQSNAPPVVVYADHVHCYICAADGVCRGSKTPGHFPLAVLAGQVAPSKFRLCVDKLTHWGHAKYVAAQFIRNERVARLIYSAALKLIHPNDPRIPAVFTAGEPGGLVRYCGYWADKKGHALVLDKGSSGLRELPAACYVDAQGEVKPRPTIPERLAQTADLTDYGYPAVCRVWGIQLSADQEQPADKVSVVVNAKDFTNDEAADRRPRYIPPSRRMSEADAWITIETALPRINRKLIKLLIAAKGCSEVRAGLPPMIFLTGPTGAGKTESVKIAANICGDRVTRIPFELQNERTKQNLAKAKETGSFAFFDEYLKFARQRKVEPVPAMETLLGFTEDSVSHKLYVGSVPLGDLPVFVWADTDLPNELATHAQIGRRLVHIRLPAEQSWQTTCQAAEVEAPDRLRFADRKYVDACNAIVSAVQDEFFPAGPPTEFAAVAVALGFHPLRSNERMQEKYEAVRTLFNLLMPLDAAGTEARRWGKDWKVLDLTRTGEPVFEAWREFMDGNDPLAVTSLTELDLAVALRVKPPVEIEIKKRGSKLAIRFLNKETNRVNRELFDALELVPEPPGNDGLGNAIDVGPSEVWSEGIPARFLNPLA